ncbi:two-component system response regulator [Nostoc sp. T09]|uniref:response regulator n=1 Tax=Nostoc sp. T09 TaxID=1932621 RepID=UPI000A39B58E|nr:response regulator [Nostoc sp. T09]OUL26666.1 two-component system response regulator [Nostoc sp. T09]
MKTLPISRYRFFQKLQPLSLLKKITNKSVTGCLQVFSTSGSWSIYIDEGKLIYACYSEKMFEPLYRNLQRLSKQISTIPTGIDEQLRAIFETGIENQAIPNPDYLAICWLVNQKYISPTQAGILIEQLALEVLESFLSVEEGSYEFVPESFLDDLPKFCYLNLRLLVEQCQKYRGEFAGRETSSAQGNIHSPISQRQGSFARQKPSQPPVKAPSALRTGSAQVAENSNYLPNSSNNRDHSFQQVSPPANDKKIYTIFCIDDSPSVLNAIKNFLDEQMFSVVGVTDSLKALMEILRTKPDLILLDITMPNLDGYELCSLLRKHSQFKNTPVIMVTGKTGLIDRAKAKMVKASGYLTKPFTQGDLLKTIFQHMV